jgi:hypothetical protein
MDGTQYDPGPHDPARCTRAADRKAIMQSVAMTFVMIAALVGGVLLTAKLFPWMLDPTESWLAYAATMQ